MDFEQVLRKYLDSIPECEAIMLMGMDGLAVAHVHRQNESASQIEVFAAEYTNVMNRLNDCLKRLGSGDIAEHLHLLDNLYVLTRFVTPQYYLLMAVRGAALLGFARFQLRRLALELSPDLASL